jgi:hypothetical protein
MKRLETLILIAGMMPPLAHAQVTVTPGDNGKTVIETVTNLRYGTVTLTWSADANIAGDLRRDSPYWVPGINPDGSMPLSVANEFVGKLNANAYLGITTWSLPITVYDDASCGIASSPTTRFGYDCGEAVTGSTGYPYSELGNLFYTVMGGTAHNNIKQVHGPNYELFKHVQPYLYWSQTAQYNSLVFGNDFWFQNGFQGTESEYDSMFVIPVSVTATKPGPTGLLAACADDPATCTGLLPGLGLTTTVHPARPSLRPRWDRQLIYDPVTNVAYLANANLAATLKPDSPYYVSGINPDGSMDQITLTSFLAALNNPAHPFMGLTGWNVPTIVAGGANPDCTIQVKTGEPDIGYNCDGTASDLGELYYNQFGITAGHTVNETWSWERWYFYNLVPDYYWECDPAPGQPPSQCSHAGPSGQIPSFSFQSGYEGVQSSPNDLFVMLVVPGDEVPREQRWW